MGGFYHERKKGAPHARRAERPARGLSAAWKRAGARGRVLALGAAVVAAAVLAVGVPTAATAVQGGIAQAQKNSVAPKQSDTWTRLGGGTALGTMVKIVNEGWSSSDYAIVATTKSYHDALSASGLAGILECPVMLTSHDSLSAQTKTLLESKGVKHVVVVGGPDAISEATFAQLRAVSGVEGVERVAGATASGTARAIYKYGLQHGGWGTSGDAILATSRSYQDALSIAPYAYAKKAPVFLTECGKTTLGATTASAIASGGFARTLVIGGTEAVDASADSAVTNAHRLAGADAYGTSRAVAKFSIESGMEATHMGVARGDGYHDVVCGAALCGKNNSVIILADDNNKYADIRDTCISGIVDPHRTELKKSCYVFGGIEAVSVPVWNRLIQDDTAPAKKKIDFSSAALDTPEGGYTYDGTEKKPGITGLSPEGLVEGVDYTISYTDCTGPGTATATVTGIGDYAGSSQSFTFEIAKADISGAEVVLDATQLYWTGSEQTKKVSKVILNGHVLDASTDYTVAGNTGTDVKDDYTLTVSGTGNYTGTTAGASWSIAAAPIDPTKLSVALDYSECTYDATAKEPAATVAYDGTTLGSDDYTLSYADNTDAGTATAIATLKGNLTGSKSATFTIKPYDISDATLTFAADGTAYTGSTVQAGTATVTLKEAIGTAAAPVTVVPAAGFSVVGATSATDVGIYTAWAVGSGNYTGDCTGTWAISIADLPDSMKPTSLTTAAEIGQKLSEVALPALPEGYPGTLEWKDGDTTTVPSTVGTYNYTAIFTSTNTNYKPVEVTVSTKVCFVYKVVYHANGGTLSSGTGEGTDAYGSATYSQKIYLDYKSQTLTVNAFTAPSGTRFAFWTLGTPDTALTSVDSTVTTGVKNVTTLTYVDGHDLSQPDGNADNSATAVEMYTDSSTSTSKTEAGAGATVNLYAHWIDESLGAYWMAPSKKTTTSNKASDSAADVAAATTANAVYSSPEVGVYKDNAAVKSAVTALKTEIAAGTATTLQDEWTTIMKEDKYHLYTLYQEDRPLAFDERYVESRVIQVGAHGGDGATLTFEAVHALPTAYRMNAASTNNGGWEDCELRTKLLAGGAIYANFEQGYLDDILAVDKYTIGGNDDKTVDTTSDKLWLLSYNEITGSTSSERYEGDHGGQYAWHKALSIGTSYNSALVNGHYTRAEGVASSAGSTSSWWERSPWSVFYFATVNGTYGDASRHSSAPNTFAMRPAFAM